MSRISNLTTIRNQLYNSWQGDWYNTTYYNVLLFQDIKTRLYLSGIFRRLDTPTSYFYLKRDNSLNFFLYCDIFLLEKKNISKYRNIFVEFEKYSYYCYLNYYTIYSYFFFKYKQYSIPSKINLGFNAEIDFKLNILKNQKNDLLLEDKSKKIVYSLFFQKKNRNILFKKKSLLFNSFLNNYKEQGLDTLEKFDTFFNLNMSRSDTYNLIRDWTETWFTHNKNNIFFFRNIIYFLLSINTFTIQDQTNLKNFNIYFLNSILFLHQPQRSINLYKNSFYYVYQNTFLKNKLILNTNNHLKKDVSLYTFKNWNITNFCLNKPSEILLVFKKYLSFFFLLFNILPTSFDYFNFFFLHFKKKITFFLLNKKHMCFLSDWFDLKRLFYNHKKFLKRISNFEKLKYKFLNRTYYKKYMNQFFLYFVKEIEHTISFYLTRKKCTLYNVYTFFSFFEKKEKQVPAIKDAKIVSDYIMYRLNKFYSINRVFYEIRDWQFKNYYNKKYLPSSQKITDYHLMYQDKKYPVLGMRIECSGSYKPGSRKKKKYYGEIIKDVELINKSPNNSFYADLDYYQVTSRLKSGSIGIKVWVFFKTHLYNSNKHYISIVTSD
jgi:hypothetical protein